MKAAVLYKANTPLEVVDVQQQGPQAGEARVRVKAAGGVEEPGAGVTGLKAGDHVIFSFRPQCGRCLYCSIGRSILCDGHPSVRWAMLDGTTRLTRNGQDIFQMARIR